MGKSHIHRKGCIRDKPDKTHITGRMCTKRTLAGPVPDLSYYGRKCELCPFCVHKVTFKTKETKRTKWYLTGAKGAYHTKHGVTDQWHIPRVVDTMGICHIRGKTDMACPGGDLCWYERYALYAPNVWINYTYRTNGMPWYIHSIWYTKEQKVPSMAYVTYVTYVPYRTPRNICT